MKTIEEAAHEYALNCRFKSDYPHSLRSAEDGFISGVEWAKRWIPIAERKPIQEKMVQIKLMRYIDEDLSLVDYAHAELDCNETWHNGNDIDQSYYKITHWRPI